ncbi:MAG: FAD-dependent oxidoreductase, partial [Pirellulales bacterium]|nr:FAD-dependent oxidoreductase [Pirellulales bacterium]
MSVDQKHVLIVGGGLIGMASAYYLSKAGCRVTVVDQGRIGRACSYRNCGFICPSHVLPLAEPGVVRSTLLSMLRPNAPFRIRPRLDAALCRWLWRFSRRCNAHDQMASGRAIHALLKSSYELYEKLIADEGLDCEWQKQGLLFVYRDAKQLESFSETNELLTKEFDEPATRIDAAALQEFEPALRPGLAGAWYYEHDAHLRPEALVNAWHAAIENRGVRFIENAGLAKLRESDGRVRAVLASGSEIEADASVVATGAWTPRLASILGCRMPIDPGKGYSVVVKRPERCPRVPAIFPEHRVAV